MPINVDNSTGTVKRGDQRTRTVSIDTNLANKEYYFVSFDGTDSDVVNLLEAATAVPYILEKGGDGSGTKLYDGCIVLSGATKLKLGGTVAAGDKLTATTGGVAIATTTDKNNYGAIAMQEGASGDIINVEAVQGMISAT